MDTIVWLILLIVFIGVEAATLGLASIWFAGGAFVSAIAAALHAPIWLQIVLFFATSLVLLYFTRPVAVKYFNKDRVKTNVESLIGETAVVTGEIDNLLSTGQVVINGQEWSARSAEENRIPVGTVVVVESISGVKLIVRKEDSEKKN